MTFYETTHSTSSGRIGNERELGLPVPGILYYDRHNGVHVFYVNVSIYCTGTSKRARSLPESRHVTTIGTLSFPYVRSHLTEHLARRCVNAVIHSVV